MEWADSDQARLYRMNARLIGQVLTISLRGGIYTVTWAWSSPPGWLDYVHSVSLGWSCKGRCIWEPSSVCIAYHYFLSSEAVCLLRGVCWFCFISSSICSYDDDTDLGIVFISMKVNTGSMYVFIHLPTSKTIPRTVLRTVAGGCCRTFDVSLRGAHHRSIPGK